eukprot:CAMPEP_0184461188 /NCGR_PEP_ID=MMETSP0740-20130409/43554_1 /TAXON_ID=385413 /ORGANISM="Thalassiosira miniscula, Strain CCMP1093" /LENGTH=110 /DNA_ID=CAMNT_0026834743 /DNA_START=100 /DNA_END=432 /DNA_ORIENTATION=-
MVQRRSTYDNSKALTVAISSVRDHATKMISFTHKHIEKLESLSKTVAGLPQMKRMNLDSNKNAVRNHLSMVDEITSLLQKSLSNLVQDAKTMKVMNRNIQLECANDMMND